MIGAFRVAVLGSKNLKSEFVLKSFQNIPAHQSLQQYGNAEEEATYKKAFNDSKIRHGKMITTRNYCCIYMNRYLSFACSSQQYTLILFVCEFWMCNITWSCVGHGKDGQLLQDFPFCFNMFEDWQFRWWCSQWPTATSSNISSRFWIELKTFSTYKNVEFSRKLANTGTVTQVSGWITILTLDQTFWSEAQKLVHCLIHWFCWWSILFRNPLLFEAIL